MMGKGVSKGGQVDGKRLTRILVVFFVDLVSMKKYLFIVLLLGLVFGQSGENEEKRDSTFIFFKSGDSIRVNKLDASFKIQPMIEFDLKFSDFDSTKYDISKVNKVADSQGKILINKNTLFMVKFFQHCLNLFFSLTLLYLIIV